MNASPNATDPLLCEERMKEKFHFHAPWGACTDRKSKLKLWWGEQSLLHTVPCKCCYSTVPQPSPRAPFYSQSPTVPIMPLSLLQIPSSLKSPWWFCPSSRVPPSLLQNTHASTGSCRVPPAPEPSSYHFLIFFLLLTITLGHLFLLLTADTRKSLLPLTTNTLPCFSYYWPLMLRHSLLPLITEIGAFFFLLTTDARAFFPPTDHWLGIFLTSTAYWWGIF